MPSSKVRILAAVRRVGLGVVVLNEAARAADQVQAHQLAPVVGVVALLEGGQRANRALMAADELGLADLPQQSLGADADVAILGDEQPKLVGQVEVGLVVGRGREQDAPCSRSPGCTPGSPGSACPRDCAGCGFRRSARGDSGASSGSSAMTRRDREHLARAADTRRRSPPTSGTRFFGQMMSVSVTWSSSKDPGQRRRHQRLAQADDVADQDAAALVEMVGGDLDRGHLELEQRVAEVRRDAELGQARRALPATR